VKRQIARLAGTFLVAASALVAQAPEPNVTGVVKSVGGLPIAGMEVRIEGTQHSTRTDTRGGFAFTGVSNGAQEVVTRGIGYLPARLSIRVPEKGLGLEMTALPAPPVLDTVKVREKLHVLSGVVVDDRNQPLPGASIEVITGDRKSLTTGDDGWFTLTAVKEGVLVFRTKKEGFFMTNTTVRMNDWRGIVVHMEPLPSKMSETAAADASGTSNNSAAAWHDTGMRLSMRGSRAVILSEDELAPFADMPLANAISMTKAGAMLSIELERMKGMICVLIDGRRPVGSTSLESWRAGEVEMVELYPPGTESSNTARRYLRNAGCQARVEAGRTKGPFYAVLWMK
jgi:hypothetical protein